jgi:cation-transporting ATPase E
LTAGIPAVALAAWARPARAQHGSTLARLASFSVPAGIGVALVGLILFTLYCVPIFDLATENGVTIKEINTAIKDTVPRAQTVLTYFLIVCGLLLVVFVEPPNRFWAVGGETSGDRRPAWLTLVLLAALLVIAFVPAFSQIFDLRPISLLDILAVLAAAAVWVLLVRLAWKRRLLERFLGADLPR